jgi:5-oxopent-3-ene-1,2,5-tricarboxylate decarboxylase/2-hydroxyhepta-2,4-diene-1,7-dioate isomerase
LKLARFISQGRIQSGQLEGSRLINDEGKEFDPDDVKWLPPTQPQSIVGLVLNYADHADELGLSVTEDPVLFLKPVSSVIGHLEDIVRPEGVKYMHYEGELAVVIGEKCRNVPASAAMDYVWGYTVANDVTVRDYITNTFRPPVRAKGFDTFCPIGPYLTTKDEVPDPGHLSIRTEVNGEVRQQSDTGMFIHTIPKVIEFISSFMTLQKGDIILTGTPKGISQLSAGDVVEVTVECCGTLRNRVVDEKNRSI